MSASAVAVNIVLTLILSGPFLHVGNAMATTLAGWVNALALVWLLARKGHFTLDARSRRRVPRIFAASSTMALVLAFATRLLQAPLHGGSGLLQAAALSGLIVLGLASYAGCALLFGAGSLGELRATFRRR
ncbi:MAG: polysaccharide biosynthesis C-terminal domain-containing protein [Aliidongia sp.]